MAKKKTKKESLERGGAWCRVTLTDDGRRRLECEGNVDEIRFLLGQPAEEEHQNAPREEANESSATKDEPEEESK